MERRNWLGMITEHGDFGDLKALGQPLSHQLAGP